MEMVGGRESDCGCKGVRFCALCRDSERVKRLNFDQGREADPRAWRNRLQGFTVYRYCAVCQVPVQDPTLDLDRVASFQETDSAEFHQQHGNERLSVDGLVLLEDFVSESEEADLVRQMDSQPWLPSQSGRRKQDFGPRVNFNKKKVKVDRFVGVPEYCDTLLGRMAQRSLQLKDYIPLEQCNLEYSPERGATIEFHQDDRWIWGERLISINLLSGSVMSLIQEEKKLLIVLPMPRRSLLAMFAEIRHDWLHGVLPEHIWGRRIALTMREPDAKFMPQGALHEPTGRELLERCQLRVALSA